KATHPILLMQELMIEWGQSYNLRMGCFVLALVMYGCLVRAARLSFFDGEYLAINFFLCIWHAFVRYKNVRESG
ncbi:MAG: hypothetical protein WC124_11765, partial [Desulfoplanes sp.]